MTKKNLSAPQGNFDGLVGTELCGWIWTGFSDAIRLRVAFLDAEFKLGEMDADIFRGDLLDAGIGDGCYAFKWPLPQKLYDGDEHLLRVVDVHTGEDIIGSPIKVQLPKRAQCEPVEYNHETPEQWINRVVELFLTSDGIDNLKPTDIVAYFYLIILGREPDMQATNKIVYFKKKSINLKELITEIICSEEFENKFDKNLMAPENIIEIFQEKLTIYDKFESFC